MRIKNLCYSYIINYPWKSVDITRSYLWKSMDKY